MELDTALHLWLYGSNIAVALVLGTWAYFNVKDWYEKNKQEGTTNKAKKGFKASQRKRKKKKRKT